MHIHSEKEIHLIVMQYVRMHDLLSKLVLHFPNEGRRTLSHGALLKKMGMRKGVSDLLIAYPRHGYHGAWIELKTLKGKPTPEQKIFLDDMEAQGYYTKITYGLDDALKTIEDYCF